jgi:hypothetical protein
MLALAIACPFATRAAETGKTFATPEEAVSALQQAVSLADSNALRVLFGDAAAELENPDRVQVTNEVRAFMSAFNQAHRIVRESDSKYVLEVGDDHWPFPVPIAKRDSRWFFDTVAGKEEILDRRIGRNELSVLGTVRVYVAAQREYASRDRDDDEVLEYAQMFASTPGKQDGLYWNPDPDSDLSPLGPLIVKAQALGYQHNEESSSGPQPFEGYFFKILTRQGKSAPGGAYDYIINGNMIGGFALVAWPAEYDESGIMTFIVNQQGKVYQKDLGPKTAKIAAAMKLYDPDRTWTISRE